MLHVGQPSLTILRVGELLFAPYSNELQDRIYLLTSKEAGRDY